MLDPTPRVLVYQGQRGARARGGRGPRPAPGTRSCASSGHGHGVAFITSGGAGGRPERPLGALVPFLPLKKGTRVQSCSRSHNRQHHADLEGCSAVGGRGLVPISKLKWVQRNPQDHAAERRLYPMYPFFGGYTYAGEMHPLTSTTACTTDVLLAVQSRAHARTRAHEQLLGKKGYIGYKAPESA